MAKPESTSRRRRKILCCVLEVVLKLVILIVVTFAGMYIYRRVDGVKRGFFCDDRRLQYPYTRRPTVTTKALVIWCTIPAVFMFFLYEFVRGLRAKTPGTRLSLKTRARRGLMDMASWLYKFLLGFALTLFVTFAMKIMAGRLRPDFVAVCRPDWTTINCSAYVTNVTCLNAGRKVQIYARTSFPSGHASFSMYAAVFIVVYLSIRVSWRRLQVLLPLRQAVPVLLSLYCGISRVRDNKHHWEDVLVGFVLGAVVAVVMIWPDLTSKSSSSAPSPTRTIEELEEAKTTTL